MTKCGYFNYYDTNYHDSLVKKKQKMFQLFTFILYKQFIN